MSPVANLLIVLMAGASNMSETTPNPDLPGRIVIRGEDLKRAVKAAEKVSDYMSMGIMGDTFFMEADGDTDNVRLEMTKDQLIEIKPGDAKSLFSLDYLSDMSKILGKASEITIDIGKDYPLKIRFKIAEGHGDVSYMLAPRVESE